MNNVVSHTNIIYAISGGLAVVFIMYLRERNKVNRQQQCNNNLDIITIKESTKDKNVCSKRSKKVNKEWIKNKISSHILNVLKRKHDIIMKARDFEDSYSEFSSASSNTTLSREQYSIDASPKQCDKLRYYSSSNHQLISCDELREFLFMFPRLILIDVRSLFHYMKGHHEKATHLPIHRFNKTTVKSITNKYKNMDFINDFDNFLFVCYCNNGYYAKKSCIILRHYGYRYSFFIEEPYTEI